MNENKQEEKHISIKEGKITLYKNLMKTSKVRGYQVRFLFILDSHILQSATKMRSLNSPKFNVLECSNAE
jgi:hypothetical protein